MNPWPHGDPRDVVRSIVADARYHLQAPSSVPQASWFDRLREWIGTMARGLLHRLDRAFDARNPFETAIGFSLIAAMFALLGFGIYLLVRSLIRRAPAGTRAGIDATVAPNPRRSAELLAAARVAARAGRYRDAAALLFLSAVRALDERGRIRYDAARTPGEYRRLVRDPDFDTLATDAVVALFAAAEPRGELFERMSRAYEQFFDAPAR